MENRKRYLKLTAMQKINLKKACVTTARAIVNWVTCVEAIVTFLPKLRSRTMSRILVLSLTVYFSRRVITVPPFPLERADPNGVNRLELILTFEGTWRNLWSINYCLGISISFNKWEQSSFSSHQAGIPSVSQMEVVHLP